MDDFFGSPDSYGNGIRSGKKEWSLEECITHAHQNNITVEAAGAESEEY
ncbi:MAG: hypothetical protein U5L09_13665 [Bacteroidales bacterium]|nr:hypothetical protein [Bacteroidales bacterium]